MSDHTTPARENGQVEYRDVPGCHGYRVGSDGTVWTSKRPGRTAGGWRQLRLKRVRGGYLQVGLRGPDGQKGWKVHRLVLLAFVGPCPPGCESCHENGVRDDNRLANLYWGTKVQNHRDRRRHGTDIAGARNPRAKLDQPTVAVIRQRLSRGEAGITLAAEYGVSTSTISGIKLGELWR